MLLFMSLIMTKIIASLIVLFPTPTTSAFEKKKVQEHAQVCPLSATVNTLSVVHP
jgi:hypothetical protein